MLPLCEGSSSWLPSTQCAAWVEFFDNMHGPGWLTCNSSSSRADPCGCAGLTCVGNATVPAPGITAIKLGSSGLRGTLPASLGQLSALDSLLLQSNEIRGSLPESMGGLHRLRYLNIDRNALTGVIPDSIGGMVSLRAMPPWARCSAPVSMAVTTA